MLFKSGLLVNNLRMVHGPYVFIYFYTRNRGSILLLNRSPGYVCVDILFHYVRSYLYLCRNIVFPPL